MSIGVELRVLSGFCLSVLSFGANWSTVDCFRVPMARFECVSHV